VHSGRRGDSVVSGPPEDRAARYSPRLKKVLLGLGLVVFVGTVVWLATFPVSISV
jgi:hypothetical protein